MVIDIELFITSWKKKVLIEYLYIDRQSTGAFGRVGGGMAVKKNLIDIEYYLFWYITYLVGDDNGDKQLKIRQACKSQS